MSFILRRTQNTMKKSKIIVPALGLLLLSTAASVSGTVAWFTAVRSFNTSAGDFAVVKTNADLKCVMAGGIGTSLDNNSTPDVYSDDKIVVANYTELGDSSFDHNSNGHIIAPNGAGTAISKNTALASATADNIKRSTYSDGVNNHNVYDALTWTMDFEITYLGTGKSSGLFLDADNCAFEKTTSGSFSANAAAYGFRIAFMPITDTGDTDNIYANTGVARVYAGLKEVADTDLKYVASASVGAALSGTAYTSPYIICSDNADALPTDGADNTSTASALNTYLGKFTATAGKTVHLKYMAVAWFDGNDNNVQNGKVLNELVKATLSFEVRELSD